MLTYVLRRIAMLVPVLVGLSLLVFVISRLLPGDLVQLAAGPQATASEVEALRVEFGLDRPWPVQYLHYVAGLLHGDWGRSVLTRRPVLDDLAVYVPATLELVGFALALAIGVGIPSGLMAAVHANRWPDTAARVISLSGISMPRFFLGLLLQLVFAMWLDWLPLSGRFPLTEDPPPAHTGFLTIDSILAGDMQALWLSVLALAMPAFALSLSPMATIMRMMRAATLEVLQQDYVLTERALGLPPRLIILKYVARNAVSSSLTVIGLYVGWLLGGTVLVESVFDWPGIGLYATKAIVSQDFMPLMGVTLVIGTVFVVVNLGVDLLQGVINPRARQVGARQIGARPI